MRLTLQACCPEREDNPPCNSLSYKHLPFNGVLLLTFQHSVLQLFRFVIAISNGSIQGILKIANAQRQYPRSQLVDRWYRDLYSNLVRVLWPKVEICIRKNEFYEFFLIHYLINHFVMSNFQFSDCKKAVNQALFRPTAERKAAAIKALQEALELVTNLEEVKESSKKTTKKRRRKTTKRTPSQKVADAQDRAALKTNEVGPIKPSKTARKADVAKAAASAKAVSVATGAAQRAAKKAQLKAEAETADKVASLEAKIEALTQCLALHMESTTLASPANEVSIDELPF